MKIEIEVSEDNEITAEPWWVILDPRQNMRSDVNDLAHQITGPFFSRKEAQDHLEARSYNFGPKAAVWCCSGCQTTEYRNAIRKAELKTGRRMGELATEKRRG